jgi:hypothetical protein
MDMNLRRGIKAGILGLFIALLSSCSNDCASGDGTRVSKRRELAPFSEVELKISAVAEINLDSGLTTPYLILVAERNISATITTDVVDSVLVIGFGQCIENHQDIKVEIHTSYLETLNLKGPGRITSGKKLETEKLSVILGGNGDVDLTVDIDSLLIDVQGSGIALLNGEARDLIVTHQATGTLDSYSMFSKNAFIEVNGKGSSYVIVTDTLEAELNGSGNIYVRGNPEIVSSGLGSGSIIEQ